MHIKDIFDVAKHTKRCQTAMRRVVFSFSVGWITNTVQNATERTEVHSD